jgi:hypothetical protein
MSVTWFKAIAADGRELEGLGSFCTSCGTTCHVYESPFAWTHCGTISAYVTPVTLWERLTTPKLERRQIHKPTRPALTVLDGGWDGLTLPDEDPTEGLIGGPAL